MSRSADMKTVDSFCKMVNGHGFRPRDWAKKGIPIIRIQNLNGSRKFNYFDGEVDPKWVVEPGDLLFAWAGTRGVSFGPTIWDGPRGLLNQHIYKVVSKNNVNKRWLYASLQMATSRVEKVAHGFKSTLLHVHKSDIVEQLIYDTNFDVQSEIARILDIWDTAILVHEKRIVDKQSLRKGLMQQLLSGKQRFPGYIRPWRTVCLGEVFRNRTESGREDLPLLSITGEGGVVNRDTIVRRDTSNTDKSRYLRICPGDIGYNTMRMWQGVAGHSTMEGIVSPAYTIVIPDNSLDAEFMAVFFKYPPIINLFRRYSQGLVDDTLNLKFRHFSEIKVTIPEKEEQTKIASIFRIIGKELSVLRQEIDLLKEQKKGLMQQLLTGKKRVKVTKAA